jgi:hypothetical protein
LIEFFVYFLSWQLQLQPSLITNFIIFLQQNEKIENLQRTVNAQAALISSQTEMLKEINKKLLENEQKLADFLHAKGVAASASKRPLPLPVMTSPNLQDEDGGEPSTKKLKAA